MKRCKQLDSIARRNREVWNQQANDPDCSFSRPFLDLTEDSAWRVINREGISLEVRGRDVLCLASGGGQQSAAFGVLGASVTVFDLSENMLKRDVETARHYGFPIRVEQGDMRDIGFFENESFDIVYLGWAAIDFVPDAEPVIREAARVLRPKGCFNMGWVNPYFIDVYDKYDKAYQEGRLHWEGYAITEPYVEGAEIESTDEAESCTLGGRTFRHTLSTIVNLVVSSKLRLLGFWEHHTAYDFEELDPDPDPGSWTHYISLVPWIVSLWAQKE